MMARWMSLAVIGTCATACFSPTKIDPGAEGTSSSGGADDAPAAEESPEGSTDPDDSTGAPAGGGPQLVRSVPEDGDANAPLSPSFSLYFDREVDPNDAVSHLLVSRNGGTTMPVSPRQCWPDDDPTCIAGDFPAEFLDGPDALAGDSAITVHVGPDFPDLEGHTNTEAQTVDFHTFPYERNFVASPGFIRGLEYDPVTSALYTLGETEPTHTGTTLERIPLAAGVPSAQLTVAIMVDQVDCDGLDINYGILYVGCGNEVYLLDGLEGDDLTQYLYQYTPDPPDLLGGTWSVAHAGDAGTVYSAKGKSAMVVYDLNGQWKSFHDGVGLWAAPYGVMVASGPEFLATVMYAAAQNHVYQFSLPDSLVTTDAALDEAMGVDYEFDLEVDSHGYLWFGTSTGIHVVDPAGGAYSTVTQRVGVNATRLALREDGATVHAYFVAHDEAGAPIGHIALEP